MPDVHLKLFTASEIHHMTKLSGLTHEEVLRELQGRRPRLASRAAAPRSSPTAFAGSSRRARSTRTSGSTTHDTAHRLGIPTHCTMLYGHVETYEERVDHLLRLREQQDRDRAASSPSSRSRSTPRTPSSSGAAGRHTTGADDLKMIAVSRLLLDNIPNVKAYWIMMGMPLAAVALHFGANDVQGTVVREEIFHAAGARTETEQKVEELVRFVARRGASRCSATRSTTSCGVVSLPDIPACRSHAARSMRRG